MCRGHGRRLYNQTFECPPPCGCRWIHQINNHPHYSNITCNRHPIHASHAERCFLNDKTSQNTVEPLRERANLPQPSLSSLTVALSSLWSQSPPPKNRSSLWDILPSSFNPPLTLRLLNSFPRWMLRLSSLLKGFEWMFSSILSFWLLFPFGEAWKEVTVVLIHRSRGSSWWWTFTSWWNVSPQILNSCWR